MTNNNSHQLPNQSIHRRIEELASNIPEVQGTTLILPIALDALLNIEKVEFLAINQESKTHGVYYTIVKIEGEIFSTVSTSPLEELNKYQNKKNESV